LPAAPAPLYSLACADSVHGWSAGAGGFVQHTSDGGQTWTPQTSNVTGDLLALDFGWSNTGVAAGTAGSLAVTQNGGQDWTAIAPLTNVTLRGAAVAPYASVMVVVGDGATVLRSANAGGTWAVETISGAGDLRSVASDWYGDVLYAVDSNGAIWSSQDRGVTFSLAAMATGPLESVDVTRDGSAALAAGDNGVALVLTSSGGWLPLSTGTSANLHATLALGGGTLVAAGDNGVLLNSFDNGQTFSTVSLGTATIFSLQDL
jgi:photosystem II stability/assembly factor-like uncharacterized protein